MAITLHEEFDPELLAPQVDSSVFEDHPDSSFWIGRVAIGNVIDMPKEYHAAHILRANVYIDQEGFLPPSARGANGGEYDADDNRSTHFAILENLADRARVIASVRLVEKGTADGLLPAEAIFPEAFAEQPAEIGSVEVSRLISRHPSSETQTLASLAAIRASDLYCIDKAVPNTYAVVERPLYVYLRRMGVPCHQMSEVKVTPEYGDTMNMVVRINPLELFENAHKIGARQEFLRKFYDGALAGLGLGYFNQNFLPEAEPVVAEV